MMIGARTAVWRNSELPIGCRLVKCLNGNYGFFKIPVFDTTNIDVYIKYCANSNGWVFLFGNKYNGFQSSFYEPENNYRIHGDYRLSPTQALTNVVSELTINSNGVTLNSEKLLNFKPSFIWWYDSYGQGKISIFHREGNATTGTPYSLYQLTFSSEGVLLRDFIPVVKNNVGYMYDRVSKQLFGNEGTGAFTWEELD